MTAASAVFRSSAPLVKGDSGSSSWRGTHRFVVMSPSRCHNPSLAKIADGLGPDTKSGIPFGSPPYMAPEQADGKLAAIGPPTDVYGLGCILYELLTGGPPFVDESVFDTLRQIIAFEPVPPGRRRRDVSAALESIVLKCLEKEPARRYASAFELAADLDRFLTGEPTRARPPGRWDKFRKKVRRQKSVLAILATVVTSVLLLLAGSQWYEVRLNIDRRLVERQASAERERAEAQQAYSNYARSIRQADELIGKFHRTTAWQILESQRPRPGEKDLREFAWCHLMRCCETEHRTLTGHRGDVYFVAFSPRGDLLASVGKYGTVRIWNTATWKLIRQITASSAEVNVATFAPDGNALATVDGEGKLKVWQTATGRKLFETKAHVNDAVIALFTSDGKTIITGGRTDGLISFWIAWEPSLLALSPRIRYCNAQRFLRTDQSWRPEERVESNSGTARVKHFEPRFRDPPGFRASRSRTLARSCRQLLKPTDYFEYGIYQASRWNARIHGTPTDSSALPFRPAMTRSFRAIATARSGVGIRARGKGAASI